MIDKKIVLMDEIISPIESDNKKGVIHIGLSVESITGDYLVKTMVCFSDKNLKKIEKKDIESHSKDATTGMSVGDFLPEVRLKFMEESKKILEDINKYFNINETLESTGFLIGNKVIKEEDGYEINANLRGLDSIDEELQHLKKKFGLVNKLKGMLGFKEGEGLNEINRESLEDRLGDRPPKEIHDKIKKMSEVLENYKGDDPMGYVEEMIDNFNKESENVKVKAKIVGLEDSSKEEEGLEKEIEERVEKSNTLNKMFEKYTPEQIRAILPEDLGELKVKYGEETINKFISELTKRENAQNKN